MTSCFEMAINNFPPTWYFTYYYLYQAETYFLGEPFSLGTMLLYLPLVYVRRRKISKYPLLLPNITTQSSLSLLLYPIIYTMLLLHMCVSVTFSSNIHFCGISAMLVAFHWIDVLNFCKILFYGLSVLTF